MTGKRKKQAKRGRPPKRPRPKGPRAPHPDDEAGEGKGGFPGPLKIDVDEDGGGYPGPAAPPDYMTE
jgi:hypothetical protein